MTPPPSMGGDQHPPRSQTLSRRERISSSAVFRQAFDSARAWPGRYVVLRLWGGPEASLRLGVVTGKKVFPRAVDRSRARRLMREAFRLNRSRFNTRMDVVLVGRRELLNASVRDVIADLLKLAGRAGVLSAGRPNE